MRTQNAFDFDIHPHLKKYFKSIVYIYESYEGAILCGIDNFKASLHYFLGMFEVLCIWNNVVDRRRH